MNREVREIVYGERSGELPISWSGIESLKTSNIGNMAPGSGRVVITTLERVYTNQKTSVFINNFEKIPVKEVRDWVWNYNKSSCSCFGRYSYWQSELGLKLYDIKILGINFRFPEDEEGEKFAALFKLHWY